jgi:hypothetical protein
MSSAEKTVMFALPNLVSGQVACVAGTAAGRSWDVSAGTFTIGRNEEHDMALTTEPGVSKTHAKIIGQGDRYLIVDCESRNGTLVNGELVQKADLYDGDEIRICGCVLRFTQKGGPARPRRAAAPPVAAPQDPPTAAFNMPAQMSMPPASAPSMPPMAAPMMAAPSLPPMMVQAAPPSGRILATWYVGGLLGSLLLGGAASAALIATTPAPTATPPVVPAVAVADPAPAVVAPPAPAPVEAAPTPTDAAPTPTEAAPTPTEAAPAPTPTPTEPPPAPTPPPAEAAPTEAVAAAAAASAGDDEEDAAAEAAGAIRPRRQAANTGGPFTASVDPGQTESLRSKTGGKVKTALADGAAVQKGTIIVTFESGADASELATLQDRIASLEGVEGDEAKRDLKAAKQKLAALEGGQNAPPVTASMDGVLSGVSAVPGAVLRAGEVIGKVVDGEVASRIRVTVARGTRARSGQKVMMNLKSGGSLSGTVVAVSGRTVVIDPGSEPAENVESVVF